MTAMQQPQEQEVLDRARGHGAQHRLLWRKWSQQVAAVLDWGEEELYTLRAETGIQMGGSTDFMTAED